MNESKEALQLNNQPKASFPDERLHNNDNFTERPYFAYPKMPLSQQELQIERETIEIPNGMHHIILNDSEAIFSPTVSFQTFCPSCNKVVITVSKRAPGFLTWISATICCLLTSGLCFWLPFCCIGTYDVYH